MVIVKVIFVDWNGEEHEVNVTSEMYPYLLGCSDEATCVKAIRYVKRRYTEFYTLCSVEIVAR